MRPRHKYHGVRAKEEASWKQRFLWRLNNTWASIFNFGVMLIEGIATGIAILFVFFGIILLGVAMGTAVILVAWNVCNVHGLFNAPAVTFLQAVGLALIFSALTSKINMSRNS